MKNLLMSAAVGDIAGMPYEFKGRTKDYNAVDLLLPYWKNYSVYKNILILLVVNTTRVFLTS